ncbi:CRISPR-associated endonuclease Cas3-HD [delta proteobacterium NaphS2]|nr:CRISPR-associated endonuclease Cas3-HD [delta proteobacterium NaphS2]
MDCIAHSAPKKHPGRKPHLYSDHISEALQYGLSQLDHLLSFSNFSSQEKERIRDSVVAAIMLHDMGKLDELNQEILKGEKSGRLPVDHIEAGVAIAASIQNELMGWLIRGHHAPGLPSKKNEKFFIKQLNTETGCKFLPTSLRGRRYKRSKADAKTKEDYQSHFQAVERTEGNLPDYKKLQEGSCGGWPEISMQLPQSGLTTRLLLSCLVNADHESAATYTNNSEMPVFEPATTRWEERLAALSRYVKELPRDPQNKRHNLRDLFYKHCREGELFSSKIMMCSASVGLGKTTSVMAYLLRKSIQDHSSRIMVIAPFSNIIDQTVKTLRKSIVLDGEAPEEIVAAHHHKAEFSDENMRQYATLWQAPIVVTTAVQFFETLAGAHPSKLRKLHSIAGASIFIDESHACLPVEFLKITWYWLRKLCDEWGCNIVFSSGSMVEFWNDPYILGSEDEGKARLEVSCQKLPDLFPKELQRNTQKCETKRVEFRKIQNPLSLDGLIALIQSEDVWENYYKSEKPSCLVILNTVQSCAIVADSLARALDDYSKEKIENKKVLHLSTALAPKDRERILKEILRRQDDSEWNTSPWYLIATSAVEAGVDLDFSIGFRERCSVTSFLQVSGRINRHGKRGAGVLYDFSIIPDDGLTLHPGFREPSMVFDSLWEELTSPELSLTSISTRSQRKEFSRFNEKKERRNLLCLEEAKLNFQEVAEAYKVIDSDTATVIVDNGIVRKMEIGIPVSWRDIQENSVQLWSNKISKLNLRPIRNSSQDRIYSWIDTYEYDSRFLGIMGGLLRIENFFKYDGGVF